MVITLILSVLFLMPASAAEGPRAATRAASDDTTKTTKKRRVHKRSATKTKTADTNTNVTTSVKSNNDDSFFMSCFEDCLGSLFSGIFFGGDDEEEYPEDTDETVNFIPEDSGYQPLTRQEPEPVVTIELPELPCAAVVNPRGRSSRSAPLYDQPGGTSHGSELLTILTLGTKVTITKKSDIMEETWVKVKANSSFDQALSAGEGWMKVTDIDIPASAYSHADSIPQTAIETTAPSIPDTLMRKPANRTRQDNPVLSNDTDSQDELSKSLAAAEFSPDPVLSKNRKGVAPQDSSNESGEDSSQQQAPAVSSPSQQEAADDKPSAQTGDSAPARPFGYRDIGNSLWQLSADISIAEFGNSALREEYHHKDEETGEEKAPGIAFGISAKFLPARLLLIDASVSHTHINGEPQYDYVLENLIDRPYESDLDITDIRLGGGMFISFASGKGFVSWSAGPTFFRVKESAKIEVFEGSVLVDERTDRISAWKTGADLKIEVGGAPFDKLLLAVYFRASVVPWDAEQEKSLTLDYLDRGNFSYYRIGFSIGTAFY